ncbi:hypothetical protein BpHYR1_050515 [Brachionus plicatilis]|uniref:Uncharacterized protein n=1 Tax=Brachionus plicatilis TaxID=10195 RepID=A0A3M7S8T0_BRAPC|nr:hypothetical protein BpHYR1_050515 [Brachionus plicatilis]
MVTLKLLKYLRETDQYLVNTIKFQIDVCANQIQYLVSTIGHNIPGMPLNSSLPISGKLFTKSMTTAPPIL